MADFSGELVLFYTQQSFGVVIGIDDGVRLRIDDQNTGLDPVKYHLEDIFMEGILCSTGTFFCGFCHVNNLLSRSDLPFINFLYLFFPGFMGEGGALDPALLNGRKISPALIPHGSLFSTPASSPRDSFPVSWTCLLFGRGGQQPRLWPAP